MSLYSSVDLNFDVLLKAHGDECTFSQNGQSRIVRMFQAKTDWLQSKMSGNVHLIEDKSDWICLKSDLGCNPKKGAIVTHNGKVWRVLPTKEGDCWRFCTPQSCYIRIHTKLVEDEE